MMATRRWLIATAILAAGFLAVQVSPNSLSSAEFMFTSPIASPTPVVAPFLDPTPTPVLSAEAQIALQHVSNGYSIPVEDLRVGRAATIQYQVTGKILWQATISDSEGNAKEIVTVDKNTGQVVDGEAMREAEVQSRMERYGKLEPALYERIQTMNPGETVKVSIWLASVDTERIQAEVAARYPEASLIDRRPGKETDPKLYEQIFAEMRAAEQRAIQKREAPVIAWLEERGYQVTYASRYAPLIFAELSQKEIADLSQRNDVAAIYLSKTYEPTLSSAVQTNRTTAVWGAGITGIGVQVAVVEKEGIDFAHPNLADGVYANPNNPSLGVGHATQVAGVIASTHSVDRGIAYGVPPLFSANAGSFDVADIIEATEDALAAGARVLNLSFGCINCNQFDEAARYYDHVVSINLPTVAAASQDNTYKPVPSPALAYNVIGTGGIDDKNTPNWSDDTMWDDGFPLYAGSSYQNPADGREKPEVVAVAKSVRTTSINLESGENLSMWTSWVK